MAGEEPEVGDQGMSSSLECIALAFSTLIVYLMQAPLFRNISHPYRLRPQFL